MSTQLKIFPRYIEIHTNKDAADMEKIFSIPYIHSNRTKTVFHTTIRNIDLVLQLLRGVEYGDTAALPETIRQYYEKEMLRRSVNDRLLTYGVEEEEHWLDPHQRLGVALSKVHDRFCFYYDTRTGKTPMSLQIIADDLAINPHHKWLVLCPLILIENAWLPDADRFFKGMKIQSLHASTRSARMNLFRSNANVYVANIESFTSYSQEIKGLGIHGAFVDESSTMKSTKSKFGEAAVEFSHFMKRWYLLSGTPAPNNESEYYRQLQSVDFFGVHQSFNQFSQYFFDDLSRDKRYKKLVLRNDKRKEMIQLLSKYSLFVDKEDVLETPGRDFFVHEITLPVELREHYNTMKDSLYVELLQEAGGDESKINILAPSSAVKINKLNQLASGFIMDDGAAYRISDFRIQALKNLINSTIGNRQCIIWAYYREEFEQLKELLGDNCALVYGGVSVDNKNLAIRLFKQCKVQFLVANPGSADKGLTLTNAHVAVYYSLSHSYELWKQSIERIYGSKRIQPTRCEYYILCANGTVNRAIYDDTVIGKHERSSAILNHLKGKKYNEF